jgi:hypothetical protein
METEFRMSEWARDKAPIWAAICRKYGSGNPDAFNWGTWYYFDWATSRGWLTVTSMSKARRYGWTRFDDTFDTWIETFRAFENAGVLPVQQQQQQPRFEREMGNKVIRDIARRMRQRGDAPEETRTMALLPEA